MTDSSRSALCLALSLAEPAAADALTERLRPELLAALADRFGLSQELVVRLTGPEPAALRAALATDAGEFLLAAASTGDPVLARALWSAQFRPDDDVRVRAMHRLPGLLPAVFRAADPADPAWDDGEDSLVAVLGEEATEVELVLALTGPFPGLIAQSLVALGPFLPPPVVLDACRTLAELTGAEGIEALAGGIPRLPRHARLGHPWLPGVLHAALEAPDTAAFLRERRPAGEWTDPEQLRALIALRLGKDPTVKPAGLDWELILREHERLPFDSETRRGSTFRPGGRLLRLAQWEGCPAALVRESFRADPGGTARWAAELPFDTLAGPDADPTWMILHHTLGRGIREGWLPVERVLTEVRPAAYVLDTLPYDHEPTRKALAALLTPLGTDPVNWLTCYARTGRARGTVAELIADAAVPSGRRKRHTSWPRPLEAEFPAVRSDSSRPAFLGMFQCATEEAQSAVVPHLDARAVQHLLVYGNPTPAVRDAVVAAHGLSAQVAMAATDELCEEKLAHLLDLDEPAVDAQLFRCADLPRGERERLLAGRLRGGGTRPVADELLAVLEETSVSHHRDRLTAGLESGDTGVARTIVGRLRLHVPAARLRLLTAVWERGGPDAVREVLAMDRLPALLRRHTEQLLDAPDGPARLRARLAEEESPERLLAFLAHAAGTPAERVHRLLAEGMEPPWPALVAALGAGTLPDGLPEALVDRPDCPRELLVAALAAVPEYGADWIGRALRCGKLAPDDLLTHGAPASAALGCLRRYAREKAGAPAWEPVRARAEALTREHLAANVEAWAVCLQLLPTFTGALPELVATAGSVARVHP
ncbi:hypothetical protein [Streptomyces sp. NPDC048650]|uniref:hypothetical protein n=1 Tax=Streptomyces sp. NPDC048650 TaxID=3365583 RepID=UPI0037145944